MKNEPGRPVEGAFHEGQPVYYYRTQRGGYGFVTKVPAVVIGVGAKRVRVSFETVNGGTMNRWVDPKNLEAYSLAEAEGFIRG